MGRHVKIVENDYVDRRELGYYSTPNFISEYISVRLLMLNPSGEKVLDPAVGREELLKGFLLAGKKIDGLDIFAYQDRYKCHFRQLNFIAFYRENKLAKLDYDYFVANPPYNCHEVDFIKNNKKELLELFPDVGVHNMYSMFIAAMIDLAKDGALIGLITSDSFFTAKAHRKLRKKLLDECSIVEITMCSNDLFHDQAADVRTSIVILQKGKQYQGEVFVSNRPLSKDAFKVQLEKQLEDFQQGRVKGYRLEDIILQGDKDNHEFIIECPDDIKGLFLGERLGERFHCVTGISTGKDELYLSREMVDPFTIPFYKNPGKDRFFTDNRLFLHKDFLKFDAEIDNFMVRNKSLLFLPGITCSSMGVEFTASRLPEGATFGVNANIICEDEDAWWLLAYLNSELVTYLVRGVLIRSNMITSGYVARIPLVSVGETERQELRRLGLAAYERARAGLSFAGELAEINLLVNKCAGISAGTVEMIRAFKRDLIKNT
ncbi:N-6 DNA methylase [Pseudoneobacillus sp. C159]